MQFAGGSQAADEEIVSTRKDEHLDVCLHADVGSDVGTGLGGYTLEYDALPEIALADVDLSCTVLGKRLRAPLVIGAMTGGSARASRINQRLARAAAKVGVGMALGSQRAMIVREELAGTFAVREAAPDLPLLFANVGAVQLNYGVQTAQIARAIAAVGADAINFHLNPLQEAVQPEGDTDFRGLRDKLARTIEALPVPSFVKECGAGISARTATKLATLPIAGLEVSGVGGTSWARVESHRCPPGSPRAAIGKRLAGFGVPTAQSLTICRKIMGPTRVLVASGGVRTGLDVAVAIALGADLVALARPLLEAAHESEDAAVEHLETLIEELRVLAFCTGARSVAELREVRVVANGAWPASALEDDR